MSQSAIFTLIVVGVVIVGGIAFGIYQFTHRGDVSPSQEITSSEPIIIEEPMTLPVDASTSSIWQSSSDTTETDDMGYVSVSTSTFSTSIEPIDVVPIKPKPPKADVPVDITGITKPISTPVKPLEQEEPITSPIGFRLDQLSPYYQKVGFSLSENGFSVNGGGNLGDKKINVTGWRFKTNRGETLIPRAVNRYDPSGLAKEEDIIIGAGDSVTGYIGISPIGKNIRLNKCIGHLNNSYEFSPGFPSYCPELYDRMELIKLSGSCQSFIMSLDGCRKPPVEELNNVLGYEDDTCHAFFRRFDFISCYNRYYWEPDFLKNEWLVWLGAGIGIDPEHDWVRFFDKNGLLVDSYIY
ncbi:MAG: hypothetical protein QMD65_02775 [Patescibacteria group bacterium]|nr:hypothetical protein [Patescibacteria group bacterium]